MEKPRKWTPADLDSAVAPSTVGEGPCVVLVIGIIILA
jgi:hypothetical protein